MFKTLYNGTCWLLSPVPKVLANWLSPKHSALSHAFIFLWFPSNFFKVQFNNSVQPLSTLNHYASADTWHSSSIHFTAFCLYGHYNSLETASLYPRLWVLWKQAFSSFTSYPISQNVDLPIVDIQYTYNNLLLQNMISNFNFKRIHLNIKTLHALMPLIN